MSLGVPKFLEIGLKTVIRGVLHSKIARYTLEGLNKGNFKMVNKR